MELMTVNDREFAVRKLLGKGKDGYTYLVTDLCSRLYPAGLNIDYFPTNFVVCSGKLYYVAYACNPYMEKWDFAHWGIAYWSKNKEYLDYSASCR